VDRTGRRRGPGGGAGRAVQAQAGNDIGEVEAGSARDFSVLLDVPAKVRPDREFKAAVERICGPACVEQVAG